MNKSLFFSLEKNRAFFEIFLFTFFFFFLNLFNFFFLVTKKKKSRPVGFLLYGPSPERGLGEWELDDGGKREGVQVVTEGIVGGGGVDKRYGGTEAMVLS